MTSATKHVVHTRIEENQSIRPNEVDTTSTSFTTQQEYELAAIGIIKLIHQFLALGDRHGSIKAKVPIPNIIKLAGHLDSVSPTHFLFRHSFSNRSRVWV